MLVIRKQHANHYCIPKVVQRLSIFLVSFHYHVIYNEISHAIKKDAYCMWERTKYEVWAQKHGNSNIQIYVRHFWKYLFIYLYIFLYSFQYFLHFWSSWGKKAKGASSIYCSYLPLIGPQVYENIVCSLVNFICAGMAYVLSPGSILCPKLSRASWRLAVALCLLDKRESVYQCSSVSVFDFIIQLQWTAIISVSLWDFLGSERQADFSLLFFGCLSVRFDVFVTVVCELSVGMLVRWL